MFDPVKQTMQANCYQTLGTHRGQVLTIVAAAHLVGKLWPMLIRLTYVPPVDTLCIGSMPDRMLGRGRTVRRPSGQKGLAARYRWWPLGLAFVFLMSCSRRVGVTRPVPPHSGQTLAGTSPLP